MHRPARELLSPVIGERTIKMQSEAASDCSRFILQVSLTQLNVKVGGVPHNQDQGILGVYAFGQILFLATVEVVCKI